MKKLVTLLLSATAVCLVFVLFNNNQQQVKQPTETTKPAIKFGHKFKGAAEHWFEVFVNQETGTVPLEDVHQSRKSVADFRKKNANVQKSGDNIKWEFLGPTNVGGRTRVIHFDVTDDTHKTMYTGGVTGGLWKSTDGGQNWALLENSLLVNCRNVSSITQTSDGTLYVGTGSSFEVIYEQTFSNAGIGIFKSTDGGETLTLIDATANSNDYAFVNRLASDGSRLYAATNSGLKYSDDGETWQNANLISNSGTSHDVQVAPNGNVLASVGSRIHISTDGGDNFTDVSGNGLVSVGNRKVLAISPSDPNTMYVGALITNCILDIYRTTDGGLNPESWTKVVDGGDYFNPVGLAANGNCQGSYDLALGVSSTDPDRIYIGGLTLWTWSAGGGAYQVDNYGGGETSPQYVHPDKHVVAFVPGSGDEMYIGNDGGIYYTSNASDQYPSFNSRNKGLGITQYYNIDAGIDGTVIGGSQDNGCSILTYDVNSIGYGQFVYGGDGAYVSLSKVNTQIGIVSSQNGDIGFSTNGGNSGGTFLNSGSDNWGPDVDGDGSMDNARFINPHAIWEDVDLYYATSSFKLPKDQDGNYVYPGFITHNGQSFIVTDDLEQVTNQKPGNPGNTLCKNPANNDCFDSGTNYGNYCTGCLNVYTEPTLYLAYDEEADRVIPSPKIQRSVFAMGNNSGDMWITYDMLNLGVTPFFVKLGGYPGNSPSTAGGSVTAIAFSPNGDDIYWGTSNGRVTRVSGLNESPENPVQETVASGRYISGIAVNSNFPNEVVVTAGNFGNASFVYRSENANSSNPSYSSIQGDLPEMPLFTVVDVGGPSGRDVMVGGVNGAWLGTADFNNPPNYTWTEENGMPDDGSVINSVAVTTLVKVPMARNVDVAQFSYCDVIYAGSHGNGVFRTTSLTPFGCDDAVSIPPITPSTDIEDINDAQINVYPNPTSNVVNVDLTTNEEGIGVVDIYSLTGQLVASQKQQVSGAAKFNFDISHLPSANYIVTISLNGKAVHKQIAVAR